MSHVTTSAVMTTTGLRRVDVAPEAQLASNERFHDFLESYVHPEMPKHSETRQNASTVKPQPAKTEPFESQGQTAKQPSKSLPTLDSRVPRKVVPQSEDHTLPTKQMTAPKKAALPVGQKAVSGSGKEQTQGNKIQGKTLQPVSRDADSKYAPNENQKITQKNSVKSKETEVIDNNLVSNPDATSVSVDDADFPIENTNSLNNYNSEFIIEKSSFEKNDIKENISVKNLEKITEVKEDFISKNISSIDSKDVSSGKVVSEALEEAPSEMNAENKTASADEDEKISRRDNQNTLLYQQENNGKTTTHIEMNVGGSEKIHVEIDGSDGKEHRIHINTDSPEVYQSLKDDHSKLIAALTDNSLPVSGAQSIAKADIQISLSVPSFLDMSSRDERQEGRNRSSGNSRGSTPVSSTSVTERRFLRGVVDLTV